MAIIIPSGAWFSPSLLAMLVISAVQDLLLAPVSAKPMQIPGHAAQIQDQNAVQVLAHHKEFVLTFYL